MSAFENYSGQMSFEQLYNSISGYLQKLTKNVSEIEFLVQKIGTPDDSEKVRVTFHQLQRNTNELAKDSNKTLKDLMMVEASTQSEQAMQKQRKTSIAQDYVAIMNRFQAAQKSGASREKDSLDRVRSSTRMGYDAFESHQQSPTDQRRSGQLLQIEQDVNIEVLAERESQIRRLENDILDVNQIFKDVSALIHEQGGMVESIEDSLSTVRNEVETAREQLQKAVINQRSARKKKFIIACVCVAIALLLILILVLIFRQ